MSYANWVFTHNNYDDDIEEEYRSLFHRECKYLVFGREVASTGTPHLQGYLIFNGRKSFASARLCLPQGVHISRRLGSHNQAADYCKKEGNFEEYGEGPPGQGSRTDIQSFREWVVEQPSRPSERQIANEYPTLYLRYSRSLLRLAEFLRPLPTLETGDARDWQQTLMLSVQGDAHERAIEFYVDEEGGKGKSWVTRRLFTLMPEDTQLLGTGRYIDLAHAVDESKKVFIFDVPRGCMEFFSYQLAEKLKDRFIFSTKYESRTKILHVTPHVIVFSNEYPDMDKMTEDRYNIINI